MKLNKTKNGKRNFLRRAVYLVFIVGMIATIGFLFFSLREASKRADLLQSQIDELIKKQPAYSESQITVSDGIYQKYQEIVNQLTELQKKDFKDEETKQKIEELAQEIHELRTLNPYYRFKEIKASFIPTGVPDIYGQELNISFDAVQDAIDKVRVFGPTYGEEEKKINLTGTNLDRYINITSQTSCQYCCGAKTLVRENGEAACGCAHSVMMRGLAAYLIKNHPELSDGQVLKELNTWLSAFFPKQTLSAKLAEMEKAGEPGTKELLEEFPEFLPQMVGGC